MLQWIGLLLAAGLFLGSGEIARRQAGHPSHDALLSILAVGDTGKWHRVLPTLLEGQLAVADAMIFEDRQHPVDALVTLGDNFYMKGLLEVEMVRRIRENLVLPYCHFLGFDGPRSSEVRSACRPGHGSRHVIPIHALLGNHDLESQESPRLQREAIPEFLPNWRVPRSPAQTVELGSGVSLVLFDSTLARFDAAAKGALVDALKSSRGPWRMIAAHAAMAVGEEANPPEVWDESLAFEQWVAEAIEEAGVRVHLYLAGHHHSLQVVEARPEERTLGPALHVIAGSGARYRDIERPHPRRRFGRSRLGFARIDLVAGAEGSRLEVSILQAPTIPIARWRSPPIVSRWSIDELGVVRELR